MILRKPLDICSFLLGDRAFAKRWISVNQQSCSSKMVLKRLSIGDPVEVTLYVYYQVSLETQLIIYVCLYSYIYVCIHTSIHKDSSMANTDTPICLHTCMHVHIIHTYIHIDIYACLSSYIHTYLHVNMHAYTYTCLATNIISMHTCIHICLPTYKHIYMHITYMFVCIHTYTCAYIQRHMDVSACTYTCMYTSNIST